MLGLLASSSAPAAGLGRFAAAALQAAAMLRPGLLNTAVAPSLLLPSGMRAASSTATTTSLDAPFLEVPGGARLPYTTSLDFVGGPASPMPIMPCYRTIDSTGKDVPGARVSHELDQVCRTHIFGGRLQHPPPPCVPPHKRAPSLAGAVGPPAGR